MIWNGQDTYCGTNFKTEDLLLIERSVAERYKRLFLNGFTKRSKRHLDILMKIRKSIKGCKGYDTHNFPKI